MPYAADVFMSGLSCRIVSAKPPLFSLKFRRPANPVLRMSRNFLPPTDMPNLIISRLSQTPHVKKRQIKI